MFISKYLPPFHENLSETVVFFFVQCLKIIELPVLLVKISLNNE